MKIKFSKSQWEQIGKQAGWMRLAAVPIPQNDDEVYSIFVDWINRVFKTDIFIYTSTEHLDKDSCIQAIAEIIIREPRYEYIRQIIESDFSEEAKKENINETLSYIRSYRQNGHLNEDITEIKQESDLFVRQYENIFQKCLMAKNIYENIKNKGELPDANLFTFQLAGFDNYKKILPLTTGASEGIPEDLSIYKTILDKLGSNYIKLLENPRIGQILFMMTMGFGKELFGFKQTFLKLLSKTNPKTVVDFFTHNEEEVFEIYSDEYGDNSYLINMLDFAKDTYDIIEETGSVGKRLNEAAKIASQNPDTPENADFLQYYNKLKNIKLALDFDQIQKAHNQAIAYFNHINKYVRNLLGESIRMYGEPIVPDAPPIIVFLSNDEEIEEEGKKMRHCVGSYTTRCKNRQSFVYHYNDGKNEGTIELNENKGIAQFFGYRNQGMPQECWGNVISWTKGRNPLNAKEMEEQKDTQEMTETYANLLHLTKHIGKLKHIFGD